MMFRKTSRRRAAVGGALLAFSVGLAGCDSLLEVTNFESLEQEGLDNLYLVPEMTAAAISAFQQDYAYLAWVGAILTDEAVNGHNFSQYMELDLRIVDEGNTRLLPIYQIAQGGRGVGEEMARRIRQQVDNPGSNLSLATALTYAGYGHIMLGEYFCFAPVDPNAPAIRSNEILGLGYDRLVEAIAIAQAAGSGDAERHILNLARVGAARAALGQGRLAEAVSHAREVPADFVAWIRHLDSPTALRNHFHSATTGTNRNIGVDVYFRDLNDPRVRHAATSVRGHNQSTDLWTPFRSASYQGWTQDGADMPIATDTDLRFASGLEARYIVAEAGGMSEAELRAFINERRAVGNQDEFTGMDLMAELRDQRRRDFFLDGHRLGDLRRYLVQHGVDYFPTGPHPNDDQYGWGTYDTATCLIPHRNERILNPQYQPLGPPRD